MGNDKENGKEKENKLSEKKFEENMRDRFSFIHKIV